MPTAIEEFLRVLAPVSVARLVVKEKEVGGCKFAAGEMVLLPYPAANRDPEKFERPDEVVLERQENPHSTFGLGIHRSRPDVLPASRRRPPARLGFHRHGLSGAKSPPPATRNRTAT